MMDNKLIEIAVNESEDMIRELMAAADRLAAAIEAETTIRRMLKEAEQGLEAAEAELIYDLELQAQDKAGPLAGLAKTGPAYKAALTNVLAQERQNGGPLGDLSRQVEQLRTQLDQAQIEREQMAVHFSACKHAADLKAAVLKAMVM
ncbi:hypothetical protein [Caldilinea sp.]|uniref:hypothetical protein n=1 Tax=Caldilinea sp. TaxID=2293560 RepID=UPI0021DF0DE0|nr:hypothetical protein [Caldilinea sp.]GIV73506.1 MAG: hypothetical protein KatS3mg049_2062 [Caldilinea sp.]